jgi:hypothetical protein
MRLSVHPFPYLATCGNMPMDGEKVNCNVKNKFALLTVELKRMKTLGANWRVSYLHEEVHLRGHEPAVSCARQQLLAE